MNIYRIEYENLAECEIVFIEVFNKPPWNESWKKETVALRLEDCYQTPGFCGLLAKIDGKTIGFALGHIEHWDKILGFCLKELCVLPEHQRCGVGAALMSALEAKLKTEGVEKVYLHTARDTFALSFYEKQGFYISTNMIMMTKRIDAN